MAFTGNCEYLKIQPDTLGDAGRRIINHNFSLICDDLNALSGSIKNGFSQALSGSSIVSGGTNIGVLTSSSGVSTLYLVNLSDDIDVNSLSASTLFSGTTDLSEIIQQEVDTVESGLTVSNTDDTETSVGGIGDNSYFDDAKVADIFKRMFYKSSAASFSNFFFSGSSGKQDETLEVGDQIDSEFKTFKWAYNNTSDLKDNSVRIEDITSGITWATGLGVSGSGDTYDTHPQSMQAFSHDSPTTHIWRVYGLSKNNIGFSRDFTVKWTWRIYYGASSNAMLSTFSDIKNLGNSILSDSFTGITYDIPTSGYKFIAFPDAMGSPEIFKNEMTSLMIPVADDSDGYTFKENDIYYYIVPVSNNDHGVPIDYRVYRTKHKLGGQTKFIIE